MKRIYIEKQANNLYEVCFQDKKGISILAKARSFEVACRLQERFENYLKEGQLLPVYKSVSNL